MRAFTERGPEIQQKTEKGRQDTHKIRQNTKKFLVLPDLIPHNLGMSSLPNATDGPNAHGSGEYKLEISDESFSFTSHIIGDPRPTGAQIAELYGAKPLTDFVVLQHLKTGELESLRPTEEVDLTAAGVERFFVIRGSELYRFQIEELNMEWPIPKIPCNDVRFLGGIDAEAALVMERGGVSHPLKNDELINLKPDGVEKIHIRRGKEMVTVSYAEKPFDLERRDYTIEELIGIFGVPAGYKLDLITTDGDFRELKPGEKIKAKEGMEFASHPPRGQSS